MGHDGLVMGIGAVSRATGIPEPTLRTWERRYGFPEPERTEGGHRLYSPEVVTRLETIARALRRGWRPSAVIGADPAELRRLLGEDAEIESWIGAARRLDGAALDAALRSALARHGWMRFLVERAGPFLEQVGERWSRGELDVFHEHFASERLQDLLTEAWRRSPEGAGPAVVCATLPGERHVLPLHMAAAALVMEGCRVVFLGQDTPPDQIAACAVQVAARAVVVAVSPAAEPSGVIDGLRALRAGLPPATEVLAGGRGAPDGLPGIVRLEGLQALTEAAARW